jgi:hypothetical protein
MTSSMCRRRHPERSHRTSTIGAAALALSAARRAFSPTFPPLSVTLSAGRQPTESEVGRSETPSHRMLPPRKTTAWSSCVGRLVWAPRSTRLLDVFGSPQSSPV